MKDDYVSIKMCSNHYHLTPHHSWSIITKSAYSMAKGYRQLGKCIEHWMRAGYKVFEFE